MSLPSHITMPPRPIFLCWSPDYGETRDGAKRIRATEHQEAAESWAERFDYESADYLIVGGSDATVHVELTEDSAWDGSKAGDVRVFVVSGESVPHYSAHRKTEAAT